MDFFMMELTDGSSIDFDNGVLRFHDHTGVPFFAEVGEVTGHRILAPLVQDDHGRSNIGPRDGGAVIVSWIYDGQGGLIVYIHAQDRSGGIAPIYMTADERRELDTLIND